MVAQGPDSSFLDSCLQELGVMPFDTCSRNEDSGRPKND